MSTATLPDVHPQHLSASRRRGALELTAAMALSGTIGLFVVESQASPQTVAFARCALGALALAVWCAARNRTRLTIPRRALVLILVAGGCLVSNWVLLFASYRHTSIGVATVSYHVQPFLLVLLAPVVLRERLAWRQLPWVALGFAGLVLLAQPWTEPLSGGYGRGLLEAVAAAALYALATLLVKRVSGVPPQVIALIQLTVGALLLLPLSRLGELGSLEAAPWLVTLGVVHTALMYVLMYDAYPRLTTPAIAVLGFVYPLVAVVVDAVAYDQVLSTAQLAGGVLILSAGLGRARGAARAAPTDVRS